MLICDKTHRYDPFFSELPDDQGDYGRHRCAGCAYNAGYQAGLERQPNLNIAQEVELLPYSQAGEVRHKSALAAFAKGYEDGLTQSYK